MRAPYLQWFVYLQVLDLLTTLIGFRLGAGEASPFVRWLIGLGPAAGVAASKLIALALAALCLWVNKARIVGWINYWYAGLVLWNLGVILVAA